ncbi:hypothetical protein RMAECT_1058 [Rickettsia rhipicephali str. Ect]|uniref:Uncharacterized protein n=1 Tax=Rickettsia rhipicephali str. Ect TaxID=1359199 RepID=A0A0F3PFR0_RICRH|nr:hypothetical protein RMAECT_1058 [Rickettsia rhipicephali str. Ect]
MYFASLRGHDVVIDEAISIEFMRLPRSLTFARNDDLEATQQCQSSHDMTL